MIQENTQAVERFGNRLQSRLAALRETHRVAAKLTETPSQNLGGHEITRLPFPTAESSSCAQALVYEGARCGLSVPQVLEQALKQQINQLDDTGCILLLLTLQQLVSPATSQMHTDLIQPAGR